MRQSLDWPLCRRTPTSGSVSNSRTPSQELHHRQELNRVVVAMEYVPPPETDEKLEPADPLDVDNRELTKIYLSMRFKFRALLSKTERISLGSGGIPATGDRMFWGAMLFTRIVVTAKSLEVLLPDPKPGAHWDFSAAASIGRNLFEACLVYHFLCGIGIDEVQREARFILYHLHDFGSRRRLFPDAEEEPKIHEDLVKKFDANPFLNSYTEKQRKVALKGKKRHLYKIMF